MNTVAQGQLLPGFVEIAQMCTTFFITVIAWLFFRAENLTHAFEYLAGMFSPSLLSMPEIFPSNLVLVILIFVAVEWVQREKQHALEISANSLSSIFRWPLYYSIILLVIGFRGKQQEFIYFAF